MIPDRITAATPVTGVILEKWSLQLRRTTVSCSSQLYSEHQTIYTVRDTKNDMSKVFNPKAHKTRTCFP